MDEEKFVTIKIPDYQWVQFPRWKRSTVIACSFVIILFPPNYSLQLILKKAASLFVIFKFFISKMPAALTTRDAHFAILFDPRTG